MKKAALHNLGCKVNAYETEAMQQMLENAGFAIVPFTEPADVYVINTCSVTNMADRKSRQMLHRARKQNPDAIVAAVGCYAQTKLQEILRDESADLILGNNKKHELVERLNELLLRRESAGGETLPDGMAAVNVAAPRKTDGVIDINDGVPEYEELRISKTAEHTRAFLKVQDGCNQFCSYCIIPYARGRVRSRSLDRILDEIAGLAERGYQEIVLTGIHLSSYGTDTGDDLIHLVEEVCRVDGVLRVRLGSLEPKIVTEEFAKRLSAQPKVCPHFHLSLQSGCDETLKRMNRKYTAQQYKEGCMLLRRYFAHPAITTDVIVGFPGETEEEFAITKAFLEEICFYEMHIFKYSKRQGTRAASMEHQVPEEIKAKRSAELIALGERMSDEFRSYYRNKQQEVLFEECVEIDGKTMYTGHTREYVRVIAQSEEDLRNRIVSGTIAEPFGKDMYSFSLTSQ